MTTNKIEKALRGVKVKESLAKTELIVFRLSKADKLSVAETAHTLKMSISEYLMNAHRLIKGRLK